MSTVKERLGRNVRARREQIGLSQAQLAEAVGKTDTSIGLLERGKVWPEFDSLSAIAKTLGCAVDDFFADTTPSPDPTTDDLFEMIKKRDREIRELKRDVLAARNAAHTYAAVRDELDKANKPTPELTGYKRELFDLISALDDTQAKGFLRILRRAVEILNEEPLGDLQEFDLVRKKSRG